MIVKHTISQVADELFAPDATLGISLAVVVMHRGDVLFERYGVQPDSVFGPGGPVTAGTTLISWSMAKSIISWGPLRHDGSTVGEQSLSESNAP
jgi:hypothetical protein